MMTKLLSVISAILAVSYGWEGSKINPIFWDLVGTGFWRQKPLVCTSYLNVFQLCIFLIHGCYRSFSMFFMPLLAVIRVNVIFMASLCMSGIKTFFPSLVLVMNWLSCVSPSNFISRLSTPFPVLTLLRLVFVFHAPWFSDFLILFFSHIDLFLSLLVATCTHI